MTRQLILRVACLSAQADWGRAPALGGRFPHGNPASVNASPAAAIPAAEPIGYRHKP